jgi:uroporphyrinogen decarboxylase
VRDRFLRTLDFGVADPPIMALSGFFDETLALWRDQGWDGSPLEDVFRTDVLLNVAANYGPAPGFHQQVLQEDDRTRTYVSHDGIVLRELKENSTSSMPQFIRFPVEDQEDFDRLAAERLGLNAEHRFTEAWKRKMAEWQHLTLPRQCIPHWAGLFGPLRDLMGLENLCLALYDQRSLVERAMSQRVEAIIAITDVLMQYTDIDTFWFWEDMAYNHGSLVDPKLFRRLALPHYTRVCDWLREQGVEHIWLDSDGDTRELVPIWLEAGINGHWPCEVAAGMDALEVRRVYGHDLALGGGIDKRAVAQGGEAMRRAVDYVMPLVEDGGYIAELDHYAPPNISWSNFCDYMSYLQYRLNRG